MAALHTYSMSQWIIFFFIYCFMGWVWECFYVSIRIRKFSNRGFMYGPYLPIYGSGAITMLFATLPVRNSAPLVFIVSALAATCLELVTGTAMEEIFKVRYWDYTRYKLNYKGHICVLASTAWGVAGVMLVFVLHKPIDKCVRMLPKTTTELIALGIAIIMASDFGASFREALDIREIMDRLTENTERQLKRLEKRVDVMTAVYGEELRNRMESLTDNQKARLVRFIRSNPDAESRFNSVSAVLRTLKRRTGIIIDRVRFNDKEQ